MKLIFTWGASTNNYSRASFTTTNGFTMNKRSFLSNITTKKILRITLHTVTRWQLSSTFFPEKRFSPTKKAYPRVFAWKFLKSFNTFEKYLWIISALNQKFVLKSFWFNRNIKVKAFLLCFPLWKELKIIYQRYARLDHLYLVSLSLFFVLFCNFEKGTVANKHAKMHGLHKWWLE